MEIKRNRVHWIELVEFYVARPCFMFGLLSQRIAVGNMRIQAQDLLGWIERLSLSLSMLFDHSSTDMMILNFQ